MSFEDFKLLDNEPFDNSIIRRDFLKPYHHQGGQLNQSDQKLNSFSLKITIIIKSVMVI